MRAILILSLAIVVSSCDEAPPPPTAATAPAGATAAPSGATQESCAAADTQAQMTRCWSDAAVAAEQRTGDAYDNAVKWLEQRQQGDVAKMFADAQARWEAYRDAECEGVSAVYAGGSIEGLQRARCRARLAEQRQQELELVMSDANN